MKNQALTTKVFSDAAEKYADKFMQYEDYFENFDALLKELSPNSTVLDAACGPGNITHYLLNKTPTLKITGIDLAPGMIELAKKLNPTAKFEVADLNSIGETKFKYDVVVCGFGLPYLTKGEAINFIRNSSKIIKPGGILYLSTMEDEYTKSDFQTQSSGKGPALFIHYHEYEYLKDNLETNGFGIINLDRRQYDHTADKSFCDLTIIAKKIN